MKQTSKEVKLPNLQDNRYGVSLKQLAEDEITDEQDLKRKIKMTVKRTIHQSHPLFNQHVNPLGNRAKEFQKSSDEEKKQQNKKNKKKQKKIVFSNTDDANDDQKSQSSSGSSNSQSSNGSDTSIKKKNNKKITTDTTQDPLQYGFISSPDGGDIDLNNQDDQEEQDKDYGLPKRFFRDPLKIFKNHKTPVVAASAKDEPRFYSRNIQMLSYPLYPYSYKKGDVRLDDRIEPRLRAALFDHNQVRKKYTTDEHERKKREYEQSKFEYKMRIDELDERNRQEALGGRVFIPQYDIQAQFNLHTVKHYPPNMNYYEVMKQYQPEKYQNNQIMQQATYAPPKPRFLPIIPLAFNY